MCLVHGLRGEVSFPPMDRHSLVVAIPIPGGGTCVRSETAAQAQVRLYEESQGVKRCWRCLRKGRSGFSSIRVHTWGRGEIDFLVCANERACLRRWAGRGNVRLVDGVMRGT